MINRRFGGRVMECILVRSESMRSHISKPFQGLVCSIDLLYSPNAVVCGMLYHITITTSTNFWTSLHSQQDPLQSMSQMLRGKEGQR